MKEQSKKISASREKVLPNLKIEIESILSSLWMENASFVFDLSKSKKYNKFGIDVIDVLFSANK